MTQVLRSSHNRILVIEITTDNSDNDIESVDSVTFYRNEAERIAGNGYSVGGATAYISAGTTGGALGTSLGVNDVDIFLPEGIPAPSIIRIEQDTQG